MRVWIFIGIAWVITIAAQTGRFFLQRDSLTVHDQSFGESIIIDKVRMPYPGVVTIVGSVYGKPYFQYVLGEVEFYTPGIYTDVTVPVSDQQFKTESATEGVLSQGDRVFAVLSAYKGKKKEKKPIRTIFGKLITKSFQMY